ncbi:MAG: aldehyde ferredoxin oxidoreductase C-terminal domain-containing protein [Desulfosudis oleivorans]|nr:aldehyde ferredoxin oxidoreductase C-terminal domain-containing protein [Desulfosudis oleivorans]
MRSLSKKYGGEDFAPTPRGMEMAAYEPRGAVGHGLGYATANRGACHLDGGYVIYFEATGPAILDPLSLPVQARLCHARPESPGIHQCRRELPLHLLDLPAAHPLQDTEFPDHELAGHPDADLFMGHRRACPEAAALYDEIPSSHASPYQGPEDGHGHGHGFREIHPDGREGLHHGAALQHAGRLFFKGRHAAQAVHPRGADSGEREDQGPPGQDAATVLQTPGLG